MDGDQARSKMTGGQGWLIQACVCRTQGMQQDICVVYVVTPTRCLPSCREIPGRKGDDQVSIYAVVQHQCSTWLLLLVTLPQHLLSGHRCTETSEGRPATY